MALLETLSVSREYEAVKTECLKRVKIVLDVKLLPESPASQIVESPTEDAPELFTYEGPFKIGPVEAYMPDFKFLQRQRERREIANLYGSFDLSLDGIRFKGPDIDLDLDIDIPYPEIDLSEFGFELPEFSLDLKKEDLSQFFDLGFDFSTPDWAKILSNRMI